MERNKEKEAVVTREGLDAEKDQDADTGAMPSFPSREVSA